MTPLRVLTAFGKWNAGEIAGFPAEEAERLVAAGMAAPVAEQPTEPAPAAPARRVRQS